MSWKHFDINWLELVPCDAPVAAGTVVAIAVTHFGFWSLSACRVVYLVGGHAERRFGFAYGTLTNHAESGEELFEVFLEPETDRVIYRIRSVSRPQALLARIGKPFARALQAHFRSDSAAALSKATAAR
jgi:uncharacterized protein (UPF0548 family)